MGNAQAKVAAGLVGLATLILLVAWLAADPVEPEPQPGKQAFDRELAQAYVDAGCWQCHSIQTLSAELTEHFGKPAAGELPLGPDLSGIATQYHADWHTAHFAMPDSVVHGSLMPAQRHLFEGDKLNELGRNVVKFLMTLDAPGTMRPHWPTGEHQAPAGNADSGKALFAQHCAGCHGESGNGNGPAARWFVATRAPVKLAQGEAYRLGDDPRQGVYNTLTNGLPGTGMPSFHHLGEQQRADLTEYTLQLLGKR